MYELNNQKPLSVVDSLYFKLIAYKSNYRRSYILAIPMFFLMLALGFKAFSKKQTVSDDYFSLKKHHESSLNEEAVKKILSKNPDFKPFYEPSLAQKQLFLGKGEKNIDLLQKSLKRVSAVSASYYTRFSEITVSIEHKKLEKALEESVLLKSDLLSDKLFWHSQKSAAFGSRLFCHNLIRIAMLYQALGKKESELASWKELGLYLSSDSEQVKMLEQYDVSKGKQSYHSFKLGAISLDEYIKYRERA
jgi:hypothetical protein